ncbi:MAG: DUF3298 and DUF4163 domain-containing protein [Ruminococcaceae bacterium]|nr:DUF3298 and DUF4163 domain-containing protein [Oscillospiraceae bacterium]
MKKSLSVILAFLMLLGLAGCTGGSAPQTPAEQPAPQQTEAAVPTETFVAENKAPQAAEPEVTWRFDVQTEKSEQNSKADDGTQLAWTAYETPRLTLQSDSGAAGAQPPADMAAACDAFNAEIERFLASLPSAESLSESALEQYNETDEEYRSTFSSYYEGTDVVTSYLAGDLLCVTQMRYAYYGGAHGSEGYFSWNFDLATGEFFDWKDLTDDPDALCEELRWNILGKIAEQGQAEWCFDDYNNTILAKEDFNVAFGEDGMTVYFSEYEIMPYAGGIPEYMIPYAEFGRFLNARGERLLALSDEDRALSDYYDAEEMWYWFEGAMPVDMDDVRTARANTAYGEYELDYYRVDMKGVNTLDALRARMLTRFDEAVADKRIESYTSDQNQMLREFDGVLYFCPAGRGTDMYIDSVDFAVDMGEGGREGRVLGTIHWRDYDEEKSEWYLTGETAEVAFPFVMTEDGACFTDFQAIY